MLINLHKQATTTPKVRAAIQASGDAGTALAERFGVTAQTIYKWRKRDSVEDRSHTPHRLQTTLTPAQEAVALALRKTLLVSLDDLLAVVREFLNPNASRSGLDRCLRRHGVGNLRDLTAKEQKPKHSAFKAYEPGYIHIDVKYLPQMADETSRRYLFVAIDRATRWVFISVFTAKTAANARRFLRDLERACPIRIRTVLTDNGKEFTDRLFGLRKRLATGAHEFDTLCAALEIEHRLTPPKSPQTNGMVERFNGRIEEVLQSHHFRSGEELETTLHRYVWLYNQQLPQSALGSKSPLQAMKDWHKLKPELFKKQPYYLPGCDSYAQDTMIVPTVVDTRVYTPRKTAEPRRVDHIGWIGTPSTWTEYMAPMMPLLVDVAATNNSRITAIGAGNAAPHPLLDNLPWTEQTEVTRIQGMDIGGMPLTDTPWARGKCGYKLIQYMACGIPVVASPVGVNADIVEHGVNGFLAKTNTEWREALTRLLADPALRSTMGAAGRRKVHERFSIQVWGPKVATVIAEIARQPRR
jgi:transposase InsO family protein